jgi:hypothetical protein
MRLGSALTALELEPSLAVLLPSFVTGCALTALELELSSVVLLPLFVAD